MMQSSLLLEREANDFREQHGIAPSEPIILSGWLQKLEVITVFKPFSGSFSGMAYKHNQQRFILINSNHSVGKQHFTFAHELYHLFIQQDFDSEISYTGRFDKKNKTEYDADCFAAYLLLPEVGVKSLIPKDELSKNKISIETILKIEQFFSSSRMALLYRLSEMKLIDFDKYQKYTIDVIKNAQLYGFVTNLYKPTHRNLVIGDYGIKAKKLLENDKISESHYISLMLDIGIDIADLTKEEANE
jgi:Zn-dependent peptidase ImmA (M78 family)